MRRGVFAAVGLAAMACNRGERRVSNAPTDTAVVAPPVAPAVADEARNAASNSYVGLAYDSLPRGVSYRGGSVAGSFDLAHVVTPGGEMIWLDTIIAPDARPPRKTVKATLAVPPMGRDERLILASCDLNGTLDPMIVAIVKNDPNVTRYTRVRQAWRANASAGRFDVIPIANIVCEEA